MRIRIHPYFFPQSFILKLLKKRHPLKGHPRNFYMCDIVTTRDYRVAVCRTILTIQKISVILNMIFTVIFENASVLSGTLSLEAQNLEFKSFLS